MEQGVKDSFAKQGLMQTFGAKLSKVETGRCEITCGFSKGLSQQHGFFHGGAISSLADTACGYAALTLMPKGSEVLTVELKMNFLRPAKQEAIKVIGTVLKSGSRITVCEAHVYNEDDSLLLAKMTATMIPV